MPIVDPYNDISTVQGIVSDTETLINEKFSDSMTLASGYSDAAQGFLDSLVNAADTSSFPMPILANQSIAPIAYKFNPGDVPIEPDTTIALPTYPVEPLLQAIALVTN